MRLQIAIPVPRIVLVLLLLLAPAHAWAAPDAGAAADEPAAPGPPPDPRAIQKDVASLGSCGELRRATCPELDRVIAAGDAAVPALETRLRAGDEKSQIHAATALGLIGSEAALEPLLDVLQRAKAPDVVGAVTRALGEAGRRAPAASVPPLQKMLGGDAIRDKLLAAAALGAIGSPDAVPALLEALGSWHPQVQAAVVTALGAIADPRAAGPLVDALSDGRTVWTVRQEIVRALGRIGEKWTAPALVVALTHPRQEVRKEAATALGRLGTPFAVPALTAALSDRQMMGEAALALGKIGDRRATPALLRVLSEQEVEPEAQTQVMWAIGTLGDVAALPVLEGVLQGNDDRLVYLAAEAMGRIGRIESADALVSLLDAKEHDTREMAVWALEKVSGQRLGQDPQAWRSWLSSRDGQQEGAP